MESQTDSVSIEEYIQLSFYKKLHNVQGET